MGTLILDSCITLQFYSLHYNGSHIFLYPTAKKHRMKKDKTHAMVLRLPFGATGETAAFCGFAIQDKSYNKAFQRCYATYHCRSLCHFRLQLCYHCRSLQWVKTGVANRDKSTHRWYSKCVFPCFLWSPRRTNIDYCNQCCLPHCLFCALVGSW